MPKGKGVVRMADMNPQLQEAIRYYTDPLLPTYGNASASCARAGYETSKPLSGEHAQAVIRRISEERQRSAREVHQFLTRYGWDAAREMIKQLSSGRDLGATIDTGSMLEEKRDRELTVEVSDDDGNTALVELSGGALTDEEESYLRQANNHNKNVLMANKERRQALELLLAYVLGSPEQVVRQISEKRLPDEVDLDTLSDEELDQLGDIIQTVKDKKNDPGHHEVTEAEVDIVE